MPHVSWAVAKNPLLLLLVSGAITVFLAPFVSRSWQNHQQDLNNRNDLVLQMSQASARLLVAVQAWEFQQGAHPKEAAVNAFEAWDEQSQIVSGKLASYNVPHRRELTQAWNTYSSALLCYYNLVGRPGQNPTKKTIVDTSPLRERAVDALALYLADTPKAFKTELRSPKPKEAAGDLDYNLAWRHLKFDLTAKKDSIVASVLHSTDVDVPATVSTKLDAC